MLGVDPALTSIDGSLSVASNDAMLSFTGLSSLTSTGGLGVGDNVALVDFTGLSSLTSVGGSVGVQSSALTSFAGLDSLLTIGEDLQLQLARFQFPAIEGNLDLICSRSGTWAGTARREDGQYW